MKKRKLIGTSTLNAAQDLVALRIPIATIVKVLKIDAHMNYRTAYDLIRADTEKKHSATRPQWLEQTPLVQEAPDNWHLIGGLTTFGHWVYNVGGK